MYALLRRSSLKFSKSVDNLSDNICFINLLFFFSSCLFSFRHHQNLPKLIGYLTCECWSSSFTYSPKVGKIKNTKIYRYRKFDHIDKQMRQHLANVGQQLAQFWPTVGQNVARKTITITPHVQPFADFSNSASQ